MPARHMDQGSRQAQRSSEGSHHGREVAHACTQVAAGSRDWVARHGGRTGSHHVTPRCWTTRPMGRVESVRVCVDSGGWSGVCATSGVDAAALLRLLLALRFFVTSACVEVLDAVHLCQFAAMAVWHAMQSRMGRSRRPRMAVLSRPSSRNLLSQNGCDCQ